MHRPPHDEAIARELLEQARAGNRDAFAEVFAGHRSAIFRICRRLLDDTSSAEDATSEIFLRAHRALPRYDGRRPFGPWIRSLASHYCIDQLRRRKTERSLFSEADLSGEDLADDAPDALQALARHREQRQLVEALDALPAKYRLPLVLRFYQDCDYDAIAEILGVTRNQVGTLLFRGKKQLRAALLARESR